MQIHRFYFALRRRKTKLARLRRTQTGFCFSRLRTHKIGICIRPVLNDTILPIPNGVAWPVFVFYVAEGDKNRVFNIVNC